MDKDSQFNREIAKEFHTNGSGYDVLRYICLPDLLGKDAASVLYIMGKNLARKIKPETIEEVIEYFRVMGWGELRLEKEKRREFIFELAGASVQQRFKAADQIEYQLEAGFLAQSLELNKDNPCECFSEIKPKKKSVIFNAIYTK